jgi:hypothetical protein
VIAQRQLPDRQLYRRDGAVNLTGDRLVVPVSCRSGKRGSEKISKFKQNDVSIDKADKTEDFHQTGESPWAMIEPIWALNRECLPARLLKSFRIEMSLIAILLQSIIQHAKSKDNRRSRNEMRG